MRMVFGCSSTFSPIRFSLYARSPAIFTAEQDGGTCDISPTKPARKRNGDIRRAVQQILNGTYLDGNGKEITGAEAVAIAVFSIAVDTGNRNAIAAARLLVDVIGQDKTPEERKKIKAEIAVLEAQSQKITQTASGESNEDVKIILERRGNENEGNSG